MTEDKIKVNFQGKEVEAVRVHVTSSSEHFNTYILDDGTTVKFKAVVTDILKLVGVRDTNGRPVYLLTSQNVTNVQQGE